MKLKILYLILLLFSLSKNTIADNTSKELCSLYSSKIHIKSEYLIVRNSCTVDEITNGLMDFQELGQNSGMLFIFNNERTLNFWSKKTPFPVDIAYLNNNLIIVDMYSLKPLSSNIVTNKFPASYVLELNAGWLKSHNIKIGDTLEIIKY